MQYSLENNVNLLLIYSEGDNRVYIWVHLCLYEQIYSLKSLKLKVECLR